MREDIAERVFKESYFIAQTGYTVRATAKVFNFSKSTLIFGRPKTSREISLACDSPKISIVRFFPLNFATYFNILPPIRISPLK